MKAQVSMEYVMVFGIALAMSLPLIIIFAVQTQNVNSDITRVEMQKSSLKIVDYAEEVYYMGPPSQKTLVIDFPHGINNITISNNLITFNITTADNTYLLVRESVTNLTGTLKTYEGTHTIIFVAQNDSVFIRDK